MCQDLWVLHETGCKREGFFVEFGATNGRDLSNSYLLESEFGWRGILAEPNPGWHSELRSNRPNASIDPRAVYPTSGSKLPLVFEDLWEFSSLKEFASDDKYASQREGAGTVEVETVSLEDLLESNGAPKKIDFISLDTEGGELAILEAFDFAKFEVDLICVEHNFSDDREPIHRLLNDAGYQRKFVEFSAFDDWYVREGSGFAGRQS
jgi:FkbM family methyltransferase